jgi:hypothetical protein
MVRILDVCSGTGSIHRWVESVGLSDCVNIVSVDVLPHVQGHSPTHCVDVCEWDYATAYPTGHFDVIWCSPPCTHYSRARTTASTPRDLEGADRIVQRCLDIIQHFRPKAWVMENPASGLLPKRDMVAGLPFVDASYCQYGRTYRKQTRFWTNLASAEPQDRNGCPRVALQTCNPATCTQMVGKKHIHHLGSTKPGLNSLPGRNKWLAGKIPEALLEALLGPVVWELVPENRRGVHRFV